MAEKDNKPAWLQELEAVREKSDDPTVDGLVQIGSYTLSATKATDKRLDAVDEKVDDVKRTVTKQSDDIRTEIEAGFRTVSERVDSLQKRQLMTGVAGQDSDGRVYASGDRLAAALPDNEKSALLTHAEIALGSGRDERRKSFGASGPGRNYGVSRLETDPYFAAAACKWVHCATMLQMPRLNGGRQQEIREQMERIERAFADIAPGLVVKAPYAEGAGATGGYLVPAPLAAELMNIALDSGVVASRCRRIPMTSDTLDVPEELTRASVSWGTEGVAITESEGTFAQRQLVANRINVRSVASLESLQDSVIGLLPYIQFTMAEAMGRELDFQALEGTGSPFTGVAAASGVTDIDAAGDGTDGQKVTYNDLVTAIFSSDESSVEDGAVFFMNRKIFATVVSLRADAVTAADAAGVPIFQAPGQLPDSPRGSILGFPVHTSSTILANVTKGASTSNTGTIFFGDPRRILLGVRQDLRFDVTETGPNWSKYQADMRMVGRFGMVVSTPSVFSKINGCQIIGA